MTPFRTALVTGATGFIGQHLVRRLVAENVTTWCLVRTESLTAKAEQRLAGARCLALHSESPAAWQRALEGVAAEVVFHLASPGVVGGKDPPQSLVETNVRLTCRLLHAVKHWPLRNILHAGSFSEYAASEAVLTEDSPLLPATPYGASKAAGWLAGRTLAMHLGLPLVNLRLFQVYGPGEASGRLIPYLHERLSHGQPAQLTAGEQIRDLVFISDVVEAFWAAAHLTPPTEPVAYNVCSGAAVRIREIGELVARQMLVPQSLLHWGSLPYRPGESMRAVGENSRFVQATGWQPRVGLNDGITRMLTSFAQSERVRLAG